MVTKHVLLAAGIVVALAVLFTATNPEQLPAAVFMGVFVALYVVCFLLLSVFGFLLRNAGLMSWKRARIQRLAALVAVLPVFLLGLQSIGQLTFRDLLLAVGFFVLLYLYFSRLATQNST